MMKPYFLLLVLFAVSGSLVAQKNVNTTKPSTLRDKSVKVGQSIDQDKSAVSKEPVSQGTPEVSPKDKKYTIDNCVTEFLMDKAEKTKAGYQFWFADRDFIDGRTLKMSVVGPHSATHPPHKHIEDEFFFVLEVAATQLEFYSDYFVTI